MRNAVFLHFMFFLVIGIGAGENTPEFETTVKFSKENGYEL